MNLDDAEDEAVSKRDSRALGTDDRFHRRLYETVADADLTFDEKVTRMLEVGRERFGLEFGLFCRVRDGTVAIQQAVGDQDRLHLDAGSGVWQTYCRQVANECRPVAIENVPEDGECREVATDGAGIDAYLGTPIELEGQLYGSLCFGSDQPRNEPFTDDERVFVELLSEWLSYELERHRRETQLAAVNDLSRSLMERETVQAVAERVTEAAPDVLDLPVSGVVTYDDVTGRLELTAGTDRLRSLLAETSLLDPGDGAGWQAFLTGETRVVDLSETAVLDAGDVTELAAVPLGDDGVFLTGSTALDGYGDARLEFVETVAATVRAALDRADREQQLQHRERVLAEKTGTLERLNRINGIIRTIDQALVGTTTRSEIRDVVCDQLATVGGYEFAWIGVHDRGAGTIKPVEWAGSDGGYLDGIDIRTDEGPEANGPVGRAVATRSPQVVDDVVEDRSFAPWREAALDRGFRSVISLPLVYRERLYGVLTVYAARPGVFGDLEATVLDEMSNTIAYACNAVESKRALVSERVTELEFAIDDGLAFGDLTRSGGGTLTMEEIVPRADGGFRCFLKTQGIAIDRIREACHRLPVTDSELITRREADGDRIYLFEADLAPNSLPTTVLEHGGRPVAMTSTDGTVSLRVELGADADVRGFVEALQRVFPAGELVAQRNRTRSDRTPCEFRTTLTEGLTERQLEALQTAYYSGYFERPRPRTASDIADRMGITQPTFTAHLRTAERHLCEQVFDADEDEP